jgi:hypothetical protein
MLVRNDSPRNGHSLIEATTGHAKNQGTITVGRLLGIVDQQPLASILIH